MSPPARRSLSILLGALLGVSGGVHAAPPDAHRGQILRQEVALGTASRVRIELSAGELEVEPGAADTVEAALSLRCGPGWGDCEASLARVELALRPDGEALVVRVLHLSHFPNRSLRCNLRVRVPARSALDIHVGAGEVCVADVEHDLEVDLGAGAIAIRVPEAAVRSVQARAAVGEARLSSPGLEIETRRHLVGGAARWDGGSGTARIDCHVGAGEVEIRLQ